MKIIKHLILKNLCFAIRFYFFIKTRITYYFFDQFRQEINSVLYPKKNTIAVASKTLAIFVIYQPNCLSPLVKRSIRYLYKNKIRIMLVAPHPFNSKDLEFIAESGCIALTRSNFGRDFGSYKYALLYLLRNPDLMAHFKKFILLNDSIIFPIQEKDTELEKILTYDEDVVGLAENYEFNWHIGSYFILFKKELLLNKEFQAFWKNYKPYSSRFHAIRKGELALGKKIKSLVNSYTIIYNSENLLDAMKDLFLLQTPELNQGISMHTRNKLLLLKESFSSESLAHHFALALIKYLDCFFIKRDICYRGLFTRKEVMQFVESINSDNTFLKELHLDFKNKGTLKSMSLFKKILGASGAI